MRPEDNEFSVDNISRWMSETLDPELERARCMTTLGEAIKHPLVYQVMGIIPGMANRALAEKKKALREAEAEENWYTCIFLHERPYRTQALIKYAVGHDEYGLPMPLTLCAPWQRELAASVWSDSENLEQFMVEWACMLSGATELLLCDNEDFGDLPETLTIYRGDCPDGGWSWSLDRDIAAWFAQRNLQSNEKPYPVVSGTVQKKHVLGYLTDRGESEIIVDASNVQQERRVA